MRVGTLPILFASIAFADLSCGAGAAGNAVAPEAKTASGALGEGTCHQVETEGHPLIVDWPADARSDLEVAMKQGVAVVHYDCSTIKLLRDCSLSGNYGFVGVSPKETVVKLEDADEIRANLPLHGATLSGELERGSTLDLALVMIGQRTTAWANPVASELRGACAGATHFVRAAHVGAFAMGTGTKGKVAASAELFGAGASGQSTSSKQVEARDGSIDACKQASPDAPSPPPQCSALVRLELFAVTDVPNPATVTAKPDATPVVLDDGCGKGLVLSQGKCTAPGAAAFLCDPQNGAQCREQCDKGSADSCYSLGLSYLGGGGGMPKDAEQSTLAFQKGCDGGSGAACEYLGFNLRNTKHDDAGALAAHKRACIDLGWARACNTLAWDYVEGRGTPKDPAMGARVATRGCDGGDASACTSVGTMYSSSIYGFARDVRRAVDGFERGCHAGDWGGCTSAASHLLIGDGIAKDAARAVALLEGVCATKPFTCGSLARVYEVGFGVPVDAARAIALYDKDCAFRTQQTDKPWLHANRFSCAEHAMMIAEGRGAPKNAAAAAAAMKTQCAGENGKGPACVALAKMQLAGLGVPKEPEKAIATMTDICGPQHTVVGACAALGVAYFDGAGVPKDAEKAREPLKRGCVRFLSEESDPDVCRRFDQLPRP